MLSLKVSVKYANQAVSAPETDWSTFEVPARHVDPDQLNLGDETA